jgi:hypothetical protein
MGNAALVKVGGTADPALSAATLIEVEERCGQPTSFRLHYQPDVGDRDITLLADRRLGPGSEISIVVAVGTEQHVLCHGPVHGHRIRLVHGGAGSSLEVCGSDRSIELDREVKIHPWTGKASAAVSTILGGYGLTNDVEETSTEHEENKHGLVQRDSDLRFIRRLARRYGYLFWLTTDTFGRTTAHFRRPALDGQPAAVLKINRTPPNLATLDLSWDVERATSVVAKQLHLNDKSVLDGGVSTSPLQALGSQPLGSIASGTRSAQVIAPADVAADLTQRAEAILIEEGWFMRASCETSLNALGTVVRAHTVVELQGAGSLHSGKYFVTGVRHLIDASAHVMELELHRNAWGSS